MTTYAQRSLETQMQLLALEGKDLPQHLKSVITPELVKAHIEANEMSDEEATWDQSITTNFYWDTINGATTVEAEQEMLTDYLDLLH